MDMESVSRFAAAHLHSDRSSRHTALFTSVSSSRDDDLLTSVLKLLLLKAPVQNLLSRCQCSSTPVLLGNGLRDVYIRE